LNETVDHVKADLMPDYDYDEYTRRHEEYELNKENEGGEMDTNFEAADNKVEEKESVSSLDKIEDDLAW
jgi:hypothetical protein